MLHQKGRASLSHAVINGAVLDGQINNLQRIGVERTFQTDDLFNLGGVERFGLRQRGERREKTKESS